MLNGSGNKLQTKSKARVGLVGSPEWPYFIDADGSLCAGHKAFNGFLAGGNGDRGELTGYQA